MPLDNRLTQGEGAIQTARDILNEASTASIIQSWPPRPR
jgi:hypothetical protein